MIKRRTVKRKKTYSKKRDYVLDAAKEFFIWVVVTALAFAYWMAVLLIFSLVLLNVWHVKFDQLLHYALVLMGITSAVYLGRMLYSRFR